MNAKSVSLLLAGLLLGGLISWGVAPVSEARAGVSGCWLEARGSAQKFEDGVNRKIGEGFKNVSGYGYSVHVIDGSPTEMYTALLCR